MNVLVNDKILAIPENCSIEGLLKQLDSPLKGSAIAVNQSIIARAKWSEFVLSEGDQISLFQAIAGG